MPHICHLTVLNPAIHSRIFYKLACSQIKLGYKVSIFGRDDHKEKYLKADVTIYPIPSFSRVSLKRLWLPWKLLFISIRIKADIYTIHSPELLWVGWMLNKCLNCQLIYDVHEDYAKNIKYAGYYPRWLRGIFVRLLHLSERLFLPAFDAISYAELCYDNILHTPPERTFILRNTFSTKAAEGESSLAIPEKKYLLFTGTIAAQWGIWESLELWQKLRKVEDLAFILAGFTYDLQLIEDIKNWVEEKGLKDHFQLIGGNDYVPYEDILHLLANCYCSMGLYRLEAYIQGKIPTKFYEAMAYNKPLIFTKDDYWEQLNDEWRMGISYDSSLDAAEILKEIEKYYASGIVHSKEVYNWDEDEKELRKMLDRLNSINPTLK